MKYLLTDEDLKSLKEKLRAVTSLLVFLDYDGTLTPIVASPDRAKIPAAVKKILAKLASSKKIKLAVISGRSLANLKKMVGLPAARGQSGLIYAGNHGLEIAGQKMNFKNFSPGEFKTILAGIKKKLGRTLSGFKGTLIEDKNLSLAVHFRLVRPSEIKAVKKVFRKQTAAFLRAGRIRLFSGKKVWEIRPPVVWDKGRAVQRLFNKQTANSEKSVGTIYIGDDRTDEDAFGVLNKKPFSLTVFVGQPKKSKARYFLRNHREVLRFLNWLDRLAPKAGKAQ